jgi:hypothetical protein
VKKEPVSGNTLGAPKPLRTGQVIGWVVVDPDTGEQVMRCFSRAEARDIARSANARIARVVVAK